ncbi:MAG: transcriptional regulator GlxA family with amidase domain, partial [Verrucomicrobiales bacterium]
HMPKLDRFAHMLILLRLFAESTTKLPLASPAYAPNLSPHHTEKIDRLLQYIRRHYRRTVPLAEAADLVSMSEKAFCRFFKKNTGKTLVQYLNELRIGEACRLLIQTNLPINQICKEAGFGNVSNFNRRFRERKGISPRAYRQATEMAQ